MGGLRGAVCRKDGAENGWRHSTRWRGGVGRYWGWCGGVAGVVACVGGWGEGRPQNPRPLLSGDNTTPHPFFYLLLFFIIFSFTILIVC